MFAGDTGHGICLYRASCVFQRTSSFASFLGVIAVFDFYRIVLMLTGAVGLFAQLENLLILTLTTVISYYAVDYLHIKLPHAIHVGLFLYLIVLLILIFLHFDQPDTYVVAFRFFTISNALFCIGGEPYIHMRHSIFPNATASRMPLCLSPFVCRLWWGSTWQVKSTRGHSLLLVVCLASCLIILYLIFCQSSGGDQRGHAAECFCKFQCCAVFAG